MTKNRVDKAQSRGRARARVTTKQADRLQYNVERLVAELGIVPQEVEGDYAAPVPFLKRETPIPLSLVLVAIPSIILPFGSWALGI